MTLTEQITSMYNATDEVLNNIELITNKRVLAEEPKAMDILREQFIAGRGQDNQEIGIYRSTKYARKKTKMNRRAGYGNVDLKLTGALYRGLHFDLQGDDVYITSTVPYFDELQQRYPFKIGMSQKSVDEFTKYIADLVLQEVEYIYG